MPTPSTDLDMASRGHAIWLTAIIAPIIAGVFLGLRMYTRLFITKAVTISDCDCIFSSPLVILADFCIGIALATMVCARTFSAGPFLVHLADVQW